MNNLIFTHLVIVPCSLLTPLNLDSRIPTTIIATREDEAAAIGCGLSLTGSTPLIAMQNSGLVSALNTIGSLSISYGITLPLLVSMRGLGNEHNEVQTPVGGATIDIVNALKIPYIYVHGKERLDTAFSEVREKISQQGPVAIFYEEK